MLAIVSSYILKYIEACLCTYYMHVANRFVVEEFMTVMYLMKSGMP